MNLKYSILKQASLLLFLASFVTMFSFTACSKSSKKQNVEKSQTVNTTTPQQTTKAEQQAPETTTNKTTEKTQSTAAQTTETNTASAKTITAELGKKIIQDNGCLACHSIDGKKMAGPTLKNLYGRKTTLKNGKIITANSAYLSESIKDPKAQVVKGFAPVMPRFSYLKDDQIASIIAYIKTISE